MISTWRTAWGSVSPNVVQTMPVQQKGMTRGLLGEQLADAAGQTDDVLIVLETRIDLRACAS